MTRVGRPLLYDSRFYVVSQRRKLSNAIRILNATWSNEAPRIWWREYSLPPHWMEFLRDCGIYIRVSASLQECQDKNHPCGQAQVVSGHADSLSVSFPNVLIPTSRSLRELFALETWIEIRSDERLVGSEVDC